MQQLALGETDGWRTILDRMLCLLSILNNGMLCSHCLYWFWVKLFKRISFCSDKRWPGMDAALSQECER